MSPISQLMILLMIPNSARGALPIPQDAYYMAGAGLQRTFVIPSHDLCVVRLGHYSGMTPGNASLGRALARLMTLFD